MPELKFPALRCISLLPLFLLAACGADEPDGAPAAATVPAPAAAAPPDTSLPPHQQMARDFLEELVEIDTTHSTGNTTKAAEAMAAHLLAAGFPEDDVHVLGPRPNKGNLVVRYRGRDTNREPLLLLAAHRRRRGRSRPTGPWTRSLLVEQDGYYYGRGHAR
ncbi:MAG: hypothetical protein U5K38_15840 [Woeseiaceae bacterium]|nr:hypothetical protein [Woeseiaceae bacterium]